MSNFYNVKVSWKQPKEGTDQLQKISKGFITNAVSVTDAEVKLIEYIPSNYFDSVVEEVKKTRIVDLKIEGTSEIFWEIKLITNGDIRERPFIIVLNGENIEELLKKLKLNYFDCEILAIHKMAQVVDEILVFPNN